MKKIINGVIVLLYIILIGDMILNNNKYKFAEEWMLLANIILLCVGLYYFVEHNKEWVYE